jgi:mono/diheme cytochrome c family protein
MRLSTVLLCSLSLTTFCFAGGKVTPAKKANQLVEGKKTYETYCSMCHGLTGHGDGAAAASLNPKPRNFTDAAYMHARSIDTLRMVINEGGQSVGLSPVMSGWKTSLKPDQIESVLQYVLSFSKPTKAKTVK